MDLKQTPLYLKHLDLGARLSAFGGWLMPIQYAGIIAEHNWTRCSCSLFDICHMGEFIIEGELKKNNLDRIVTVNLQDMSCGKCSYGFMLNQEGGIIDDLVVYRLKPDKWMIVVNAARIDADEENLKKHLSRGSKVNNVSAKLGKLDLQGPLSREVLKSLFNFSLENLEYYHFGFFSILKEDNIISRTGYTGELGYEIYLSNEKAKEAWEYILKDDRVRPAGLGARDTLRLEMGYPLYGQELSEEITPLEAGLLRFVDFNKDFIGRDALLKRSGEGISKKLTCFIAESRRSPRHNYKIYSDDREIGVVTSGSFSPSLGLGIGMGYVQEGFASAGGEFLMRSQDVEINATVIEKPFYKHGSARGGT